MRYKILPILLMEQPNIKILLAGSSPVKSVMDLASENVTISGWIDDIRHAYAKGKIFIAPLNIGTGLQNKLLEAMSMKIPSITSELANNALKATPNQHLLLGSSASNYAQIIIDLLKDNERQEKLGLIT